MVTLAQWAGDGLAAGITVTTGTVGTGDTAPALVTGTAPVTHASGPRPVRMKFDQAAGQPSYVAWNHTADGTMAYRWYTRFQGTGSSSVSIAQGMNAGNQRWRLELAGTGGSPSGELRLRNSANTLIDDSGALAVPFDTELRIEATLNADVLTAWVFVGDGLTEVFSVSGTVGAGVTCDQVRIGNIVATTMPTFYLDDVKLDDTAVRIGPAGAPLFPEWYVWNGTTEAPLTVEGVYDGISVNPITFGQLT